MIKSICIYTIFTAPEEYGVPTVQQCAMKENDSVIECMTVVGKGDITIPGPSAQIEDFIQNCRSWEPYEETVFSREKPLCLPMVVGVDPEEIQEYITLYVTRHGERDGEVSQDALDYYEEYELVRLVSRMQKWWQLAGFAHDPSFNDGTIMPGETKER